MIDIKELRKVTADCYWPTSPVTIDGLIDRLEAAEKERDALRAKIARMERQEPVRHEFQGRDGAWYPFIDQRHYENTVADGTWPIRALYALPGAQTQPAPKGVDGWREGVESAARLIDQKAELYAIRFGRDDIGGLSFGQGPHAEIKIDHYTSMIELADEVRATLAAAPKPEGE